MGVGFIPLAVGASFDIVLYVLAKLGPPVVLRY